MASFDWVCLPCLKIGLTLNDSRLHVPATNESASVNIQESVDHEKTQVLCTVSIKPAVLVFFRCDNPEVNLI